MKKKRLLSVILLIAIFMSAFIFPVSAGVPASDVAFTVKSLKVTSSPIEEENDITVEVVYHASVTNHGWSSSVWYQCGGCGGAGAVLRYGGGGGGKVKKVTLTCGQQFEGKTWMCRSACDGYDYTDQEGIKGNVTHNTENPWDNDSSNNWDDGGQHIWDKQNPIACECSMKVAVGDKGANSGMIACRGCGGLGSIYRGTETCSSCKGSGGNCTDCGGSGDVKVFDQCAECSGTGAVTEYITCDLCGGAGGEYVTITHPPSEPVGQISTMVDIRLEGKILETKEITFDLTTTVQNSSVWTKEGDVTVVWTINTDEGIGEKDVETDINEGEDSKVIPIIVEPACNLTVQFVPPNSPYRTGTEVISTFVVQNHNDTLGLNIRPKHKLTADFTATSGGKTVATKKVTDIVIPKGKSNIIYFKWLVPDDIADVTVKCDINTGYIKNTSGVNEKNHTDNTASEKLAVGSGKMMTTPDTKLEYETPREFILNTPVPKDSEKNLSQASWEQWEWANDWYIVGKYSAAIEPTAKVKAEKKGGWQVNSGDSWTTRSGYGINTNVVAGNKQTAKDSMITNVQRCVALVPEFNYKTEFGISKSLVVITPSNNKAKFEFPDNNIHYTPIWFPNGKYQPSFYAYDYWTPAGMLSGYATDSVGINGDMYLDWNSNRR